MKGGRLAGALLIAAGLAGCGDGSTEAAPVQVPTASADLDPMGAYYAEGTLHLGDQEQEVGGLRDLVVAARTVAYEDDAGRLCFTDLADQTCTDYEPHDDLRLSADGQRLGFLDAAHGPKDRFDTRQLTATVLDLTSGDVLLSSTDGMGDLEDDDLADLYEDAEPSFRGFDADGEAVVDGTDGKTRGGTAVPREVPGETRTVTRQGKDVTLRSGVPNNSLDIARVSPDGEFAVVVRDGAEYDSEYVGVDASGGRPFELAGRDEPWWAFGSWSGPHQFLATTTDEAQRHLGVLECDLKTRACQQVDRIPIETGDVEAVVFP